ncbi:glutathione S-transferase 1-like isoform X1 [Oscarella lobularis]|uniref:glutathione S-transferase 1-like isoform X1 n=1 Tax=Oscarella lobularis TaxID=121494 RepID=UPI00331330B5
MPSYKLTYFPGRGRAEIIRFVLAAGNVDYEDVRIAGDKWKEFKEKTPEGKLPIFESDGVVLSQSQAIAAYAAELGGLRGETPIDRAKAHMIVEMVTEMFEVIIKNHFEKDEAKKEEKEKEIKEKLFPAFLTNAEKFLVANGGEYFAGSKLTYADVALFNFADNLRLAGKEPFGNTPKLAALIAKVGELPGVKDWIAKRPESQF